MRINGRESHKKRNIEIQTNVLAKAEGSCLIKFGNTHVMCTASLDNRVPPFLRGKGSGWVTAEYGMLPRSTERRMNREAAAGRQGGRTQEIQRLIGRSLRACIDLGILGERQIIIDCDVIQADGGTRTAAITGGYVALYEAVRGLMRGGSLSKNPIFTQVAAISCGIVKTKAVVDLDFIEDSAAEVDANFVMNSSGNLIEVQATAEENSFSQEQFIEMLGMAQVSIKELMELQRQALKI